MFPICIIGLKEYMNLYARDFNMYSDELTTKNLANTKTEINS